jgi:hypothetical protein
MQYVFLHWAGGNVIGYEPNSKGEWQEQSDFSAPLRRSQK